MSDAIQNTSNHLRALREKQDPVSAARREAVPPREIAVQVLHRLRAVLLDSTPNRELESELEVASGLLSRLVGPAKAERLIERLPEIRSCLALDIEAAHQGDPAATTYAEIVIAYPSIMAVSTYRIAHALYQMGEPVIARIMSAHAHSSTGIDIHPGAEIGCHFFIDHGTGVVIGETTVIGNRVKLYHGVTLGAFSNRHGRLDAGKNATVLGGDTVVGRGSVIGGNVWVTGAVPANSTVTIENPRLRIRRGDEPRGEGDQLREP
jgi:serine O-acetyltransferase